MFAGIAMANVTRGGRPVRPHRLASNMGKDAIQGPRHPGEIQRADEQWRGPDLPAAARAEESPELLLLGPSSPSRLPLEAAERFKLTLSADDLLDGDGSEGTNQLVLQVCDAHVETELFHIGSAQAGTEPRPLETVPEVVLLCSIAEARQPAVEPPRAEEIQESPNTLRTTDRHDTDALSSKIPTAAHSECLDCELVADAFNKDDRPCRDAVRRGVCHGSIFSKKL
jgi:hypothetical protein